MLDEVEGLGQGALGPLSPSEKARGRRAEGKAAPGADGARSGAELSGELRALIERVKHADTFRKERVHAVLEKLQRGELTTPETVWEAARRILEEGV